MMRLEDVEFLRLLPEFMREDAANIGLSKAVDDLIRPLAARLKLLSTWGHIDALSEAELDELAWELDIQWYYLARPGDIETKRRLVRESDLVHARLGTPWAVEETVRAFFGSAVVQEWNEYDGQPGHFRIAMDDIAVLHAIFRDERARYLRILDLVKRKSAWYDGEVFTLLIRFPNRDDWFFRDFKVAMRISNFAPVIRFNGERKFDGSWLFHQGIRGGRLRALSIGMRLENTEEIRAEDMRVDAYFRTGSATGAGVSVEVEVGARTDGSARQEKFGVWSGFGEKNALSGAVVMDSMWRFNGEVKFDGSRKFHAKIIQEEI